MEKSGKATTATTATTAATGTPGLEVLVFASRDCRDYAAARALAQDVGGRFIDRLTADIDALRWVVHYGVVEPVVIIIRERASAGGVRARIPRLLTLDELRRDLLAVSERPR